MEKLLLRINDVADRLSIGRSSVYALVAEGRLDAVKVGASMRIPADAVERFVADLKATQLGHRE